MKNQREPEDYIAMTLAFLAIALAWWALIQFAGWY